MRYQSIILGRSIWRFKVRRSNQETADFKYYPYFSPYFANMCPTLVTGSWPYDLTMHGDYYFL